MTQIPRTKQPTPANSLSLPLSLSLSLSLAKKYSARVFFDEEKVGSRERGKKRWNPVSQRSVVIFYRGNFSICQKIFSDWYKRETNTAWQPNGALTVVNINTNSIFSSWVGGVRFPAAKKRKIRNFLQKKKEKFRLLFSFIRIFFFSCWTKKKSEKLDYFKYYSHKFY